MTDVYQKKRKDCSKFAVDLNKNTLSAGAIMQMEQTHKIDASTFSTGSIGLDIGLRWGHTKGDNIVENMAQK